MASSMRTLSILFFLTGLALVLASAVTPVGLALFTAQPTIPDNNFTTDPCFPNADTGFLDASAQAADSGGDGDGFEVNPTNAFADGGTDPNHKATNNNGRADRHRFYNYGISIDSSCSIQGFEVRLDWWLDGVNATNSMSVELSWDGGANWTAAKTDTVESTTEHTTVLGGSADTWGRTWAVSELSDANFRLRVTSNSSGGGSNVRDFFLDWVPVKVYFVP